MRELIDALRCCGHNMIFHYCDNLSCPYCKYSCSDNLHRCDTQALGSDAADAIEELISRVPKWISVNEKLPDSQRPVLVYVPESEGFCEYVGMADYTWSPKGGFWCGTDGETYGAIGFIRTPTYWCELPEPPKGE